MTSFEYRLHPVKVVFGGMVLYPLECASEVLPFFHEFSIGCPDEINTVAALLTGPDGARVVAVLACHCGPLDQAEPALRALRLFGSPVADTFGPLPYTDMQRLLNDAFPPGRQHYWKSNFLRGMPRGGVEAMVFWFERAPSPLTAVALQQMHGVAARVPPTATAFPHRAAQYDFVILSQWPEPSEAEANIAWTRGLYTAMEPFLEKTVYVNDLDKEGDDRVRAAFGQNYDRLAAIKAKYDPTNFFRQTHNVRPAAAAR